MVVIKCDLKIRDVCELSVTCLKMTRGSKASAKISPEMKQTKMIKIKPPHVEKKDKSVCEGY